MVFRFHRGKKLIEFIFFKSLLIEAKHTEQDLGRSWGYITADHSSGYKCVCFLV